MPQRDSFPGFGRVLAVIGLVWLVAVLVLAASEALRAAAAPAPPATPQSTPQTTPRANTNPAPVNCHQSAPPTSSSWLAVASRDAQTYGVDVPDVRVED